MNLDIREERYDQKNPVWLAELHVNFICDMDPDDSKTWNILDFCLMFGYWLPGVNLGFGFAYMVRDVLNCFCNSDQITREVIAIDNPDDGALHNDVTHQGSQVFGNCNSGEDTHLSKKPRLWVPHQAHVYVYGWCFMLLHFSIPHVWAWLVDVCMHVYYNVVYICIYIYITHVNWLQSLVYLIVHICNEIAIIYN